MPIENGIYYFHQQQEGTPYPALVLIHGAGGNHLSWPPELRRLSGQTVYAVDLPGHGKSAGQGEQGLAAYADRLLEWMDAVRVFRAFLVGHSMGGGIALELALAHPHRIAGLVLVSSGARLPVPEELVSYSANQTTFAAALALLRTLSFSASYPARLAELVMQRLGEVRPSVLHNDLLACSEFDATERLPQIHQPALVVCGAEDRLAPLRQSQFLASKLARAELKVVQGAGHMAPLEKPAEVADLVSAFLSEQRRRF